mgnify:CR=1 FL=1
MVQQIGEAQSVHARATCEVGWVMCWSSGVLHRPVARVHSVKLPQHSESSAGEVEPSYGAWGGFLAFYRA